MEAVEVAAIGGMMIQKIAVKLFAVHGVRAISLPLGIAILFVLKPQTALSMNGQLITVAKLRDVAMRKTAPATVVILLPPPTLSVAALVNTNIVHIPPPMPVAAAETLPAITASDRWQYLCPGTD